MADGFAIQTDSQEVSRQLDYLVPGAKQPGTVTAAHRFQVRGRDTCYAISENGRHVSDEPDAERVVNRIYARVHEVASGQFDNAIVIHAGTGVAGGCRFLAVGPKFSGKSTLMTRLLFHGAVAEGDEMAILSAGTVTAFPRRFHLRESSLPHLPELAPLMADIPSVVDAEGRRIYGFDPGTAGLDWTIGTGAPDAIFFLEGNHGGDAVIADCARIDMCRLIMPHCMSLNVAPPQVLATVSAMVGRARTCIVRGGTPDALAAALFRRLA